MEPVVSSKQRVIDALVRLAKAPGRVGWLARRLLGWMEPEDITRLYTLFLGRSPSDAEMHAALGKHWRSGVEDTLALPDRDRQQERKYALRLLDRAENFTVSVDATREELDVLFRATQSYWQQAGSDERTAYWSILTHDEWRSAPRGEELTAFYDTGRQFSEMLTALARELCPAFSLPQARVLDFGCGIGRILLHFVGKAAHCEGWDFSQSHLDTLETNLRGVFGLEGFSTRLLDSPDIAQPEQTFDFVYGVLVLQHNPPPLMAHLLRGVLRTLAPGGLAFMHIPTAPLFPGYSYSVERYRTGSVEDMEMHAIPLSTVLRIAKEERVEVPWAKYTNWCGPAVLSQLFVFTRPSAEGG